jgi:SAM-dependent methyltransferase
MGFGNCWGGISKVHRGTLSLASKKIWEPFDTGEDKGQWDAEYWNHPYIHGIGNTGWGGEIHARVAPLLTKLIDHIAYDGMDAREMIHCKLKAEMDWSTAADLCCGTGVSTPLYGIGVDTSEEMIGVASGGAEKKRFRVGNAESWGEDNQFELVTCMFGFHEMPATGREKVIRNMLRIASKKAVIVDIVPSYVPGKKMLSGEPYVLDYLAHINDELVEWEGADFIEDHIRIWEFNLVVRQQSRL